MMLRKQLRGRAMNDDDEIWADEDEPSGSDEPYDAMLVDIKDQTSSYGRETIEATTDDEAIGKAREWARAECTKRDIEARLIVTGGTILGSQHPQPMIVASA
jgi:hypothetical protein